MSEYRFEATLNQDGALNLIDLPFHSGDIVEVIVWARQRNGIEQKPSEVYGPGEEFRRAKFWARGYYESTVGRDEAEIRHYNREQEKKDRRLDQLKLFEETEDAGVAGQTALSGSQIKPSALPEVRGSYQSIPWLSARQSRRLHFRSEKFD